jgi:hypothetical protein
MTIKGQQQLTSSEAPNKVTRYQRDSSNPVTTSSQLSHNLAGFAIIPLTMAVWFLIDGFPNVALGLEDGNLRMAASGALSLGLAAGGIVIAACLMAAPKTAAERARDDEAQMQALKAARK